MSAQASDRVMLSRLAHDVIAASDGVSATAGSDRRWASADGPRAIEGVVAVADGQGRFELELHLVVDWPSDPLEDVAERLRDRLCRAAAAAGLEERLGEMLVAVEAVRVPGEEPA
jgi:hypothetical protein